MSEPTEAAKKTIADSKEARAKSDEQREKLSKSTPTPSQDENDLAAVGAHVHEKADDGSGPDPEVVKAQERDKEIKKQREARRESRQSEADKPSGGGYQTRQSTARPRNE